MKMKIGDIVVVRNIYGGASEYILGEVISDVVWISGDKHMVKIGTRRMGRGGERGWEYVTNLSNPYYNISFQFLSCNRSIHMLESIWKHDSFIGIMWTHHIIAS